jgi:hypothetical protein
MPRSSPFMTVVLMPTAGHILRANRNMGFSFRIPLSKSCLFVFLAAANLFLL